MNRKVKVKQPVSYTITTPEGKVIESKTITSTEKEFEISNDIKQPTKNIMEEINKEWDSYFMSAMNNFYIDVAKKISNEINHKYGYCKINRRTSIFMGKGRKHDYTKHLMALKKAQRAYENLFTERNTSLENLKAAVQIWETELKESKPKNKKAKINGKVTPALMCNLIEAKTILGDYTIAVDYCDRLDIMPKVQGKYIRFAENMRKFIKDEKLRNKKEPSITNN